MSFSSACNDLFWAILSGRDLKFDMVLFSEFAEGRWVATDEVATYEIATDEIATYEIATDEMATDEIATDKATDQGLDGWGNLLTFRLQAVSPRRRSPVTG